MLALQDGEAGFPLLSAAASFFLLFLVEPDNNS